MSNGKNRAIHKDMLKAFKRLEEMGCRWQIRRAGHIGLYLPNGELTIWSQTPNNMYRQLQRLKVLERRLSRDSGASLRPTPSES